MSSCEKINALINQYMTAHPGSITLEEEYMHPSVLAMHTEIQPWLMSELGGTHEYWNLLLESAKEWFPDKNKTKLGRLFCNRFEIHGCTFWNGLEEYQTLTDEYHKWRGITKK